MFDLLGNLNTSPQTNVQSNTNNNNNLFPDLTSILGNQPAQNPMNNNNNNNNNMFDFNSMGMNINNNNNNMNINNNNMNISNNNMNINNNNMNNMFNFNTQNQTNPGMKEIYKNNEITIYSSLTQMNDTYTGSFLISNNISKKLYQITLVRN